MRQLQVRLQRLALPDMENQIPEGQGNSLKGINKKTGSREGASYIFFFQKIFSEWKLYMANTVKSYFCFKLKIFNLRKKCYWNCWQYPLISYFAEDNIDPLITPSETKLLTRLDDFEEKNEVFDYFREGEIIETKTSAIEIGQNWSKSVNIDDLITPSKTKFLKPDNFEEKNEVVNYCEEGEIIETNTSAIEIGQHWSKCVGIDDLITPPKEKNLKLDNLDEKNEVVDYCEEGEIIETNTSTTTIEIGQYLSKSFNIDHFITPPKTKILTKPDDFEEKNELVDQYEKGDIIETKRSDIESGQFSSKRVGIDHLVTPPKAKRLKTYNFEEKNEEGEIIEKKTSVIKIGRELLFEKEYKSSVESKRCHVFSTNFEELIRLNQLERVIFSSSAISYIYYFYDISPTIF